MIIQPRFSSWPFLLLMIGIFLLGVALSQHFVPDSPQPNAHAGNVDASSGNSTDSTPNSSDSETFTSQTDEPKTPSDAAVHPAEKTQLAHPGQMEEAVPQGKYLRDAAEPADHAPSNDVTLASNQEAVAELQEPSSAIAEASPEPSPEPTRPAVETPNFDESTRVANLPSNPIHQLPELTKPDLKELLESKDSANLRSAPANIPADSPTDLVKKNWYQPTSLIAMLDELSNINSTSTWAKQTKDLVQQLGPAFAQDSNEAARIIERLAAQRQSQTALANELADSTKKTLLPSKKNEEWNTIRKLHLAGYALERRLDVWNAVARVGAEKINNLESASADADKLYLCLSSVESSLPNTMEGQRWREYLLLDALKQIATQKSNKEKDKQRQLALGILERIDETPMSSRQRQFVNQPQVIALREELRQWAADPISAAGVLKTVERYEKTGLASDAKKLARTLQSLTVSPDPSRRELASKVDAYYRNANLRIAISEKMLNRLIPAPNVEYAPVHDRVLGIPVHGQSLASSDLAIRLIPDPDHARLALEVTGEVAATTSSTSGPATFYNDSESVYAAQKQVEINKKGFRLLPAEVDVKHQSRLRDVSTDFDGIPIFGSIARRVAQTQHDLYSDSANGEARQKVAAKAKERIDNAALDQFSKMVEKLNENVFGPLVNLSLEPTILDAQTTSERLTMRLRVAGEDQLGSHTPRPQAPMDCLASFQIHESMLNNALARLQLEGNTFTLKELADRFSQRFQRPNVVQINPEHEDVKITFADKDALAVHCRDGEVMLVISVAELSKAPRQWNNFQVNIFFKPDINGRSAELVGAGTIHLISEPMSMGSQIALRGVFAKAFPRNQRVPLMPERFMSDAKLKDLNVTQFTIDNGWIGVALGDRAAEIRTARAPKR